MEGPERAPRCAHQIHVAAEREGVEPSLICSCPAGLIHMHDCPLEAGLACAHFVGLESEPEAIRPLDAERLREELMDVYLSRPYRHRVQSLSGRATPWQQRREMLAHRYAEPDEPDPTSDDLDAYERERDHLIALRKEREEARQAREERTREEKARERARMGIKTVVERARDAVAAQGNHHESLLDEKESAKGERPESGPKRRRRRGRRGGARARGRAQKDAAPPPAAGEAGPADGGTAPKKRRRRRRRKPRRPPGPPAS